MININTVLTVIDNSGAKKVKCINVLGVTGRKYAKVGDIIVVSVKEVNPEKTIKKGVVLKGIIVRLKKENVRQGGEYLKFDKNGVVLLKNDGLPFGSRVIGPIMLELRKKGYMNIVSLAGGTL